MASNYEHDFEPNEGFRPPSQELSAWNTWTTRTVLKSLSGLFLAFPVLAMLLSFFSPLSFIQGDAALINFCIGLILWGIFYQMEREYRRVTPDRIR